MATGVHRSTPDSRRGRSMFSPGRDSSANKLTPEQQEWNAKIEEKKADKRLAKLAALTVKKF